MKTNSLLLFFIFTLSTLTHAASPQKNKKIVTDFCEMAFNAHRPEEAMKKFVGEKYIQHNPYVSNGQKPFIDFFIPFFKEHPKSSAQIKRVIAEGDLVVVHSHSRLNPNDSGEAVVDIFRLENEKIVEHWDVVQPVPDKAANTNTMF